MSLLSPKTILSPQKRKELIRENILTHNYAKLASLCHCTKRTIKRDVQKWKQEGGFEQFLIDEFFHSYPNIKKEFPEKAFDRLCYLLGKTMTRKVEAHTIEEIREIKLMWIKNESNSTDKIQTSQRTS